MSLCEKGASPEVRLAHTPFDKPIITKKRAIVASLKTGGAS